MKKPMMKPKMSAKEEGKEMKKGKYMGNPKEDKMETMKMACGGAVKKKR